MAITKTTTQSNAEWLASVQTFRDQLEIYKNDMEEIKNDFEQISLDVTALRQRAENCELGIYVYGAWNLFSRTLALQNLIQDPEKLDRVRTIMRQGLGIPNSDYNGELDSDFTANISAENIKGPDSSRAAVSSKIYPTE